jgi:hypothetical membrane protein
MTGPSFRAKISSLAGMLGPLMFTATFTIEGWLRPGYDARRMFISALSLGPRGWIQIVNFMFLGITLVVFSRSVAAAIREGRASRAGHVLLTIVGTALFVSGPFVMDPMGTVREQTTVHGILHGIFGAVVFSLTPVVCFVFWRRFHTDTNWRTLRGWTLGAAVMIAIAVVLLRIGTPSPPESGNALTSWIGLIQRAALVTFLAWVFTFARALYRRVEGG